MKSYGCALVAPPAFGRSAAACKIGIGTASDYVAKIESTGLGLPFRIFLKADTRH